MALGDIANSRRSARTERIDLAPTNRHGRNADGGKLNSTFRILEAGSTFASPVVLLTCMEAALMRDAD